MHQRVYLVASGDLRLSANRACWPAQERLESGIIRIVEGLGATVDRRPAFDPEKGHGFLDSQWEGLRVFAEMGSDLPVIVACAAWQYSHHVLPGLTTHRGPILTVANWSGQWPGLVGMLNLNGSLAKAGVRYSTTWVEDFDEAGVADRFRTWLAGGTLEHDTSHVCALAEAGFPDEDLDVGRRVAHDLLRRKAIMGVFDEGLHGNVQCHRTGLPAPFDRHLQGAPQPERALL